MNISRRKLLITSITILLMILLSKIFSYSSTNFAPKYGETTARVNFRKSANLNSNSIVKTLNANTPLRIVGEIDNFYITQLQSNEVGLIAKEYSKIQEGSTEGYLPYTTLDKFYAKINENNTNLRGGPGTNFSSYDKLAAGTIVEVIGKINNWYLVVTNTNTVGMIREDLLQKTDQDMSNPSTLPNTVETALTLINDARTKAGVNPLKIDDLLNSTAQAKAVDMVKNNYFSHQSPTYGSPFEMMKNAGITYKTAGENIAGNSSVQAAVESWLASDTHRQNILSNAYNYIGIGIEPSDTYGYVIVAMFIGK